MEQKVENFTSDIHVVDYAKEYEEKSIKAETLIAVGGRKKTSLDGMWHFHEDWYDTNLRAHWYKAPLKAEDGRDLPVDFDFLHWPLTQVPSCWNNQRLDLKYFEGSGLYAKSFSWKKEKDHKVFLCFEGAAYRTTVFVNQQFLGLHDGGSTPFMVDVTDALQEENILLVDVDGRRKDDRIPPANTDWFQYGGLYRSVYLVTVPEVFIKDWFVRLKGDKVVIDAELCKTITTEGILEMEGKQNKVTFSEGKLQVTLDAPSERWSPGHPHLTSFSLTVREDKVSEMIGLREITTKGNDILLNGKKIHLRGISVHEDHPVLGKCTNDQVIIDTITRAKELGCNYLRLAHYPHTRRFAELADQLGIMLWEEVPVYWAVAFENKKTYQDAENQLAELIIRDRNRASVIIWSVGNENADTDARFTFMRDLARKAKRLDDSRLVSAACLVNTARMMIKDRLADELDVIGLNEYFGWYDPEFDHLRQILENSKPTKPVILTEFGAGARSGFIGKDGELFSEENQKKLYERQFEVQQKRPFIAGTSPWVLYDFRCPRRFNRWQDGYNRKGLLSEDRTTKKEAFTTVQHYYRSLKKNEE